MRCTAHTATANVGIVDGRQGHDLDIGVVGVNGERVAAAHGQIDVVSNRYRLKYLHHVLVRVAEHTLAVDVDEDVALLESAITVGGAIGHDELDLQKVLARLIGADDGEAEAVRRLEQRCLQELALELVGILREVDVSSRVGR